MLSSGIYKITSPNNKIYIGRSVNIKRRFSDYKRLGCKAQTLLYMSFLKHGVESHCFEVIEYCEISKLNERESYFIKLLSSTKRGVGLNCTSGGDTCVFTKRTRTKMSKSATGRISVMKGKRFSDEVRLKMSLAKKGKPAHNKGKKKTPEQAIQCRLNRLGKPHSEETKRKMSERRQGMNAKKVIDTKTQIVYNSIKDAAFSIGLKTNTLGEMLRGANKNKTNFKYFNTDL